MRYQRGPYPVIAFLAAFGLALACSRLAPPPESFRSAQPTPLPVQTQSTSISDSTSTPGPPFIDPSELRSGVANVTYNAIANIIVAILASTLTFTITKYLLVRKRGKAINSWRSLISGNARIIVGRFSEFDRFEASGFIGMGDARAIVEIQSFVKSLGIEEPIIEYADEVTGKGLRGNIILLGGPDANSATGAIVAMLASNLRFGRPHFHEISIYDKLSGSLYSPSFEAMNIDIEKDYGVILRSENPVDNEGTVLILAGSFGYGTWAAARFAISRQFREEPVVAASHSIECLIETRVIKGSPEALKPIVCRPF